MAFGDINREDYGQLPNLSPNLYATRAERRAAERKAAAERRSKGYTKPSLQFGSGSADKPRESSRSGLSGRSSQLAPVLEILNPQETRQMGRSVTSRRGTIADERANKGSVVRAFGTEYDMSDPAQVAAYEREQEEELRQQRLKKLTVEPETETLTAETETRQPNRTVTSPNSGNMPMNWAEYEKFLNNYGLTADEIKSGKRNITLSGFESNNLPGGIKPISTDKPAVGISQAGASSEADINDQSRAHEVDQTKNRALPRGARQREMFLRQNPNYGQKETPEPNKGGLSARSEALLAYDGKGGMLGAIRAADASQNLMRYGDRFAVKVGDGEYTEITREGADKIRSDMRDQKEFSQEFLSNYLATPAKPADAQSESAVQPKRATVDLDAMAEAYKPGYFPKELGFNVSYNDEIPDMGLDPKLFSLGIIGKRK